MNNHVTTYYRVMYRLAMVALDNAACVRFARRFHNEERSGMFEQLASEIGEIDAAFEFGRRRLYLR